MRCGATRRPQLRQTLLGALLVTLGNRQGAAQQNGAINGHQQTGACSVGGGLINEDVGGLINEDDRAVNTVVETIAASTPGLQGYTTYRVSLNLATEVENVYSIYGGENRMVFPPAYQVDAPFGADVGGVNPLFFPSVPESQYDSWLTVGIDSGNTGNKLSSIGVNFHAWNQPGLLSELLTAPDEDHHFVCQCGLAHGVAPQSQASEAVTCQGQAPNAAPWTAINCPAPSVRNVLIAQLTVPANQQSARCAFSVQGRSVGHDTQYTADWEENCVEVYVGGTQNGHGTHPSDPSQLTTPTGGGNGAGVPPPAPAPVPSTVFGMALHSSVRAQCSDINALMGRAAGVQRQCCPSGQNECSLPQSCATGTVDSVVGCTVALSGLLDTCGDLLDELLPSATATALHQLHNMCLGSLTVPAAVEELKHRVAAGMCTDADLEGIAVVQVSAEEECVDARDGCEQLAKLMSCETDFCPTCANAGQCDLTCNICSASASASASGHRRVQNQEGAPNTCSIDEFGTLSQQVTEACCDPGTGGCDETGDPPTECDARCAVTFVDFFDRCSNTLRAFAPTQFHSYVELNQACSQGTPLSDLLGLLGGACAIQ